MTPSRAGGVVLNSDAPDILVFKEAKRLLRCSASTLLDCIHDGSVPAFKLGRTWRFYRADLMAIQSTPLQRLVAHEDTGVRPVAGKRGWG